MSVARKYMNRIHLAHIVTMIHLVDSADSTAMHERIFELKTRGFLTRLLQLSDGDVTRSIGAGDVGEELGLPMEQTLQIVEALEERGAVHSYGALDLPHGPAVHLTPRGLRESRRAA
jgi:hypothetical protein